MELREREALAAMTRSTTGRLICEAHKAQRGSLLLADVAPDAQAVSPRAHLLRQLLDLSTVFIPSAWKLK